MDIRQINGGGSPLMIEGASEYKYIEKLEEEHSSFRQLYYLWISRFFIVTAVISIGFMVAASLSLFRLAPMVNVEPFLLINQNDSEGIVRNEAILQDMVSKEKLLQMHIRQYIILRNTIINDQYEMRTRWMSGGMVNFLSSPQVFGAFGRNTSAIWDEIFSRKMMREVEIISLSRQGGPKSSVWKIDFKTYDLINGDADGGKSSVRVRYWTASLVAFFVPDRAFILSRLANPLGFTVTRYSQTEVEVF